MNGRRPEAYEPAAEAYDYLLRLGDISVRTAEVPRLIVYPSGRPENDAEHSFHLQLSATELAGTYFPELDTGLVAQFCGVHDLPEIYAGDTPSYDLSPEEVRAKEAAEAEACERLLQELPPYTAQLLQRYEAQIEPEARFVRFVDKLLPAIIHTIATEVNREPFLGTYGITDAEELEMRSAKHTAKIKALFPDSPFLHRLRDLTARSALEQFFPPSE